MHEIISAYREENQPPHRRQVVKDTQRHHVGWVQMWKTNVATHSLFVLLSEQLMSPPHLSFLHSTSQSLSKGLMVLSYRLHKDAMRLISQ